MHAQPHQLLLAICSGHVLCTLTGAACVTCLHQAYTQPSALNPTPKIKLLHSPCRQGLVLTAPAVDAEPNLAWRLIVALRHVLTWLIPGVRVMPQVPLEKTTPKAEVVGPQPVAPFTCMPSLRGPGCAADPFPLDFWLKSRRLLILVQ